jgi:hypothetical protein
MLLKNLIGKPVTVYLKTDTAEHEGDRWDTLVDADLLSDGRIIGILCRDDDGHQGYYQWDSVEAIFAQAKETSEQDPTVR